MSDSDDSETKEHGDDTTCTAAALVPQDRPPLFSFGDDGKLVYHKFALPEKNSRKHHHGNIHQLPDFSYAGYRGGGVAIPNDVPVVEVIEGPRSQGDNSNLIQSAIQRVEERPLIEGRFRGAILIKRGHYRVRKMLVISKSGVVLRGEGQGPDGTKLYATANTQTECVIKIHGQRSIIKKDGGPHKANVTSDVIPIGATSFDVDDASIFQVGNKVGLVRCPKNSWIKALDMAQYGWKARAYKIVHYRRIVAIQGNTITVDVPIVDGLDSRFCTGILGKVDESNVSYTSDCGVEDIRLETRFAQKNNQKNDEEHAWNGIVIQGAMNCWVRRVTTVHFGYAAVMIAGGDFNTVQEVASLDPISKIKGGRRYTFYVVDGIGTLFQRCYCEHGRHDYVSSSRVAGPHVWLDCFSERAHADAGPHHRWATGLLFDNCQSNLIRVQNRQASGSGHGWAGAQCLLWNCVADLGYHVDSPDIAMSWSIGCRGDLINGKYTKAPPRGWIASHNNPVANPRSLYLQQLQDRLGPDAVLAITTPRQRAGNLYQDLQQWAGNGRLPSD